MFTSLTSKVLTAVCAVIGAIAFVDIFFLAVTGGSPYLQFGLALVFFAMFHSGVVLVDDVRAGTRSVRVLRA